GCTQYRPAGHRRRPGARAPGHQGSRDFPEDDRGDERGVPAAAERGGAGWRPRPALPPGLHRGVPRRGGPAQRGAGGAAAGPRAGGARARADRRAASVVQHQRRADRVRGGGPAGAAVRGGAADRVRPGAGRAGAAGRDAQEHLARRPPAPARRHLPGRDPALAPPGAAGPAGRDRQASGRGARAGEVPL
ncbi:MAG: hypothetical protein AVDCRST_MAG88-2060, partial [uncultured Thermomicrobiales bacterium]